MFRNFPPFVSIIPCHALPSFSTSHQDVAEFSFPASRRLAVLFVFAVLSAGDSIAARRREVFGEMF